MKRSSRTNMQLSLYVIPNTCNSVSMYGVASVSRIDKIIALFCKRSLQKRRYSAKETCNFVDPSDRSKPMGLRRLLRPNQSTGIHTYRYMYINPTQSTYVQIHVYKSHLEYIRVVAYYSNTCESVNMWEVISSKHRNTYIQIHVFKSHLEYIRVVAYYSNTCESVNMWEVILSKHRNTYIQIHVYKSHLEYIRVVAYYSNTCESVNMWEVVLSKAPNIYIQIHIYPPKVRPYSCMCVLQVGLIYMQLYVCTVGRNDIIRIYSRCSQFLSRVRKAFCSLPTVHSYSTWQE